MSETEEKATLLSRNRMAGHAADEPASDEDTQSLDGEEYDDGRSSAEISPGDRVILEEEEERETLLTGGSVAGPFQRLFSGDHNGSGQAKLGKREKRRMKKEARRARKRRIRGEDSELMYEMEEGGRRSDSDSSLNSSEEDKERLGTVMGQKASRRSKIFKRLTIHTSIIMLFVILLFAAYRASTRRTFKQSVKLLSNGTSNFAATTILISLDGFRADFLNRGLTPTLNAFIQEGISPKYMMPSFPSVTFPNHYTMVTGLYPESHGIVGNTFWDPKMKAEFYYTDPTRSLQAKWWGGEPIWATAESQGIRSAVHMWPGSEAHIEGIDPAYVDKYNGSEVLSLKLNRILEFLDLPGPDSPSARADRPRPQLIAAYVPNVDADGHRYGPNSTEIRKTIQQVDSMLGDLFNGLRERNLTDVVNVVVASDHGMATTSTERLVQLEDLIDPDLLEHIDGWPLYGLRPKRAEDLESLYMILRDKANKTQGFDVYLRDRDMPERYHFSNNERIAPLWIVPWTGWAIVTKEEFDVEEGLENGDVYHPRGIHGYDHEHPLMRAIFIARGPAFPHKPGSRMDPFQNIELYNIVCDSVGIMPKPNNGTLRLPLKPAGLHSDPEVAPEETPADRPVAGSTTSNASVMIMSDVPDLASLLSDVPVVGSTGEVGTATAYPSTVPSTVAPAEPTLAPSNAAGATEGNKENLSWWDWFHDKLDGAKGWAYDLFHKTGGEKESSL